MRILELFSGIGGVAEALARWPGLGTIQQAVDIDQQCAQVYQRNHGAAPRIATIDSPHSWQHRIDWRGADCWWLSPPCQPYCRRGRQDDADPRRGGLLEVMAALDRAGRDRPFALAMENVPEFAGSADHGRLLDLLDRLGYRVREQQWCLSDWHHPNRRRRYYLTAWQRDVSAEPPRSLVPPPTPASGVRPLADFLDAAVADALWLPAEPSGALKTALDAGALDIVRADDPAAVTACFTGGYGKSIKQAGSYLRDGRRLRRFSPTEIQRLLGFRERFAWPDDVSLRRQWKMLGNSLAIPVIVDLLRSLTPRPSAASALDFGSGRS